MAGRIAQGIQNGFAAARRTMPGSSSNAQTAALVATVAVAGTAGVVLAKKRQARKERQQAQQEGMPALTTPPHPGQVPLGPPADPEVFSPGFNIHPELSTVPTLLDGAEVSQDVRMLAGMYNQTYETPEYDANAALEMIMGHPPGTRDHKQTQD